MKRTRILPAVLIIIASLIVMPVSAVAGIQIVSVSAEGEGSTVVQATALALSSAVAQVNGALLESSQLTTDLMRTLDTETGSSVTAESTMASAVSQQTKGLVREYRVLSKTRNGPVWVVNIEADIAKYERSVQTNRLRMSVLPFRVKDGAQPDAAERFAAELNAHLTQSRKFAMLDRQFEDERQIEMGINSSAEAPIEEMAKLGHRLGTDYMIVGEVQEGGVSVRSMELAGRKLSSQTARFTVSYQVIDAPTGQVKFADSWSHSAEGQSVMGLASQAAEIISREIVEAIAPMAVESVADDIIYLGQGGKAVKVGQQYRLLKLGEVITDRYTGERLGQQELDVGLVEIIDVQSKLAKARILESNLDVASSFPSTSFVVRLAKASSRQTSAVPNHSSPTKSPPKKSASSVQTLKAISEDDW